MNKYVLCGWQHRRDNVGEFPGALCHSHSVFEEQSVCRSRFSCGRDVRPPAGRSAGLPLHLVSSLHWSQGHGNSQLPSCWDHCRQPLESQPMFLSTNLERPKGLWSQRNDFTFFQFLVRINWHFRHRDLPTLLASHECGQLQELSYMDHVGQHGWVGIKGMFPCHITPWQRKYCVNHRYLKGTLRTADLY